MPTIRPAAVAGMFYPGEGARLAADVDAFLSSAARSQQIGAPPKAIIVPHAGYVYSGAVAASAYAHLRSARDVIRRVVLLGPVHRVPVRGLALPAAEAFDTPLGRVPLDAAAVQAIRSLPQVVESRAVHEHEHSLEVHLPFLQRLLERFTLVPLAVGDATREQVAEVLDVLWGGPETLIVVSSDLSHYLAYDAARKIDTETAAMIVDLRSDIDHQHACGGTPVNGLMLTARRRKLEVKLVDLRNSGDTAGTRDRVVGYGSFLVHEKSDTPNNAGASLIGIAKAAIDQRLGGSLRGPAEAAWLREPGATFVTLTRNGELRGCIGTLQARRALAEDVHANAVAAAFNDPRFKPLTTAEWIDTWVEVSLLSALEPIQVDSEQAVLQALRPGVDGLVLEFGHHRGTFLPQVWEQLASPQAFLSNLKRKAGLPLDFWDAEMTLARYTVSKWREQDFT
jgi:AmmeMemoRadiSam system protein B/AmmeMemoRadiSam system protein A